MATTVSSGLIFAGNLSYTRYNYHSKFDQIRRGEMQNLHFFSWFYIEQAYCQLFGGHYIEGVFDPTPTLFRNITIIND